MAQHSGGKDKARRARPQKGRSAPGSHGQQGQGGEQYQQKDMGAHPAHGQEARGPGKEEDYGARGLHRRAGTTKREGMEERGIGHAEDYDARYDEDSSKVSNESQPVVKGQDVHERDEAGGRSAKTTEQRSQDDVENDPGNSGAGGSKHSKRDPASR